MEHKPNISNAAPQRSQQSTVALIGGAEPLPLPFVYMMTSSNGNISRVIGVIGRCQP